MTFGLTYFELLLLTPWRRIPAHTVFERLNRLLTAEFSLAGSKLYERIRLQLGDEDNDRLLIILWWTPFMTPKDRKILCGEYKCVATSDRKYKNNSQLAAYLFYGSQIVIDSLPLPRTHIPWAIYHEESPKNLAFFQHTKGQQLFDIVSTFSRNSHLPIPLQYLESVSLLTDLRYYIPVEVKNKLNISPTLYIQSDCETPIERDVYVKELMKYIKVDSFGRCLNNKQLPNRFKIGTYNDVYEEEFMKFVSQYKFTIALENAACNDYMTEKLWRPLIVGSVPIYLGSPTINDWVPNNKSVILVDDFSSVEELAEYINTFNGDDELYMRYMQHKVAKGHGKKITNQLLLDSLKVYENVDHPISAFECLVCRNAHTREYLYKKLNESVYECPRPVSKAVGGNFWMQHWDMGKCEAKTLQYFIRTLELSNFTKAMFDEQTNKYFEAGEC